MVILNEHQIILFFTIVKTSMGWVGISGNRQGLKRLVLPEKTEQGVFEQLNTNLQQDNQLNQADRRFTSLAGKIKDYFNGKPIRFDKEKINLVGYTPFQQNILLKTREIPYGKTRTYQWLAEQSGYARAYRAVGGVMRINPLPLIIPCHRIISSRGKLTGFSATGGTALKKRMLELEGWYDG